MSDIELAVCLYDRHFDNERFSLSQARQYLRDCGFWAYAHQIRAAAKKHCQFWNPPTRRLATVGDARVR